MRVGRGFREHSGAPHGTRPDHRGRPFTDDWKHVYDAQRLARLLTPPGVVEVKYTVSRHGVCTPSTESEAGSADWNGPDRAVALVVATKPPEPRGAI